MARTRQAAERARARYSPPPAPVARTPGPRSARPWVVLGVVLYCLLMWAAAFKMVKVGVTYALNLQASSYAERADLKAD